MENGILFSIFIGICGILLVEKHWRLNIAFSYILVCTIFDIFLWIMMLGIWFHDRIPPEICISPILLKLSWKQGRSDGGLKSGPKLSGNGYRFSCISWERRQGGPMPPCSDKMARYRLTLLANRSLRHGSGPEICTAIQSVQPDHSFDRIHQRLL